MLTIIMTESLQRVLTVFPFSSSFTSPNYSNMAFQLLAYAVENITGTPFPELIKSQLIQPLNLRNTFVTMPSSNQTSNAFILPGWDYDFGDEAPYVFSYLLLRFFFFFLSMLTEEKIKQNGRLLHVCLRHVHHRLVHPSLHSAPTSDHAEMAQAGNPHSKLIHLNWCAVGDYAPRYPHFQLVPQHARL